mmetsp:Transcript_8676/g.24943  ORF Transcript_8676/g.24943 Transcript_8676/m.24943 type:complete len:627 (-) Transcript_8676:159-2039(-)|eukprot:CAMPEP_0119561682 /NCGR_PEP_ID=MMETSP1352-20130426/18323_1 /TAXON_ID=265584 /ORGANISM="Stauroneis constricta, Strain CCMP1120" /LENGTH=626 /DNA_ID=CAMNT_0007609937 /DNA_START=63 /DNA_END=1943 /DNA_ORIENTATION=-
MSSIIVKVADSLDWQPKESLVTAKIELAGSGFFEYSAIPATPEEFHAYAEEVEEDLKEEESKNGKNAAAGGGDKDKSYKFRLDLFELSEAELDKLNYYQVLQIPFMAHLTPDQLKQAYRKACLKYHPDKSGRGQEDAVFLKVQTAFETLSTQKQAYDSTELPFDESIPAGNESEETFFKSYSMVFERNLHFDTRLLNATNNNKKNNNNNKKKKRNKNKKHNPENTGPPSLGDKTTSIDDVHRFYDYWAHFSTWRDFTIQAARELETEDQLEQAESRYEKRWYQREIDRLAKKLKQKEQIRISTLVERAMAADPRLKAEKQRLIDEKRMKQEQREKEVLEKQRKEQEEKEAAERQAQIEKEKRAQDKFVREKEKKLFRKVKQAFRRSVTQALVATSQSEHAMAEDVELVCDELDREALTEVNAKIASKSTPEAILVVVTRTVNRIKGIDNGEDDDDDDDVANIEPKKEEKEPEVVTIKEIVKEKKPFTKDELSALAKAIKKYPPGGANRWDQIATFINNICKPDDPRTKEECIETYNKIANKPNRGSNGAANGNGAKTDAPPAADGDADDQWTEDQDKQLQDGLTKFPASMNKNERWTSIAKEVPGKTKKDCVQRFKAIRDAIKNKK